ncbi:caspase-8-like [Glandiceps talaboti]
MAVNTTFDPLILLFLDLNGHFDEDDEHKIRQHLSGGPIPKRDMKKLRDLTAIFLKLRELGKIDKNNLGFLKEMFQAVGRQPLVDVVEKWERENTGKTTTVTDNLCKMKKLFGELSGMLDESDEQTIRTLLTGNQISKHDMTKLMDPADIFAKLVESGHIAADDVELLKKLFARMRKEPLVKIVKAYEKKYCQPKLED